MSQRVKLVEGALSNPRDIRFGDALKIAEILGFEHSGGSGSHRSFSKTGEPEGLNFQDRDGKIPTYQGKQLCAMIEKYWDGK